VAQANGHEISSHHSSTLNGSWTIQTLQDEHVQNQILEQKQACVPNTFFATVVFLEKQRETEEHV